jgi:hypothetical protein
VTQILRVVVDLEVPDHVDVDGVKEALEKTFPGRARFPEEGDVVVFFRPFVEYGEVTWGTVAPPEVQMYCSKTGNQMLRGVEQGDVYYNALGEILGIGGKLALDKES